MYQLRPLSAFFGVEVLGLDMATTDLSNPHLVRQLQRDLIQHRVLLFRKQQLSGQRQVDISSCFGTLQSTFFKHPRSPHPDIFRVSNNEEEGCTNVGRSGWHCDGTFQLKPFTYQTMYFESVAQGGDTLFIPLKELYESAPAARKEKWNKTWMVTGRRQAPVHPLVCQHPFRNEVTMLFHCGEPFVRGWLEEDENKEIDSTSMVEAALVQRELTSEIESKFDTFGLRMKWDVGDFMINDNLGLAHYATQGTQGDWREVGLRILHRTTIVGGPETLPKKIDGRTSMTS
jgi:taurine dioxygenase